MQRWMLVIFRIATLLCIPSAALGNTWPRLSGANQLEQCGEALQIAKATFESDEFFLYAPPVIPVSVKSMLVLQPEAVDISGGDALKFDPNVFDKLQKGGEYAPGSVFWKRTADYGNRLLVDVRPHGWQGDVYSVFVVKENFKLREFLAQDRDDVKKSPQLDLIILNGWRPPLIFQNKKSEATWLIDVGPPYAFLSDWEIHVVEPKGAPVRCTIQFRPEVENAAGLLPQEVRILAGLLDSTMGKGANEGTGQWTARLRLAAQHTWANAALRPWALREPYNTRGEVDDGLKDWSRHGATHFKVYRDIQRQYSLAEQSLAEYYQRNFGRSAKDARASAVYALDIALRSHFAFHSNDPNKYSRNENAQRNPWRSQ